MVHKVTAHYISDRFLLLFKRLNAFSFLALLITATSALFVFYSLNQLRLASEHRLQSYTLSEELRLSSDQLTKMARAYAVTGDLQFKNYFNEVLAIRSGELVRPKITTGYIGIFACLAWRKLKRWAEKCELLLINSYTSYR